MIPIAIILMFLAGLAAERHAGSFYRAGMITVGCLLLASEIWKQITLTVCVFGGHYHVWYFPFQLCSLPMYLCPLMAIRSERWQRRVEVFLMDFTLLGALAVFLDTTGMHYPLPALTVHSYGWHLMLIFLGSWSGFHRASERRLQASSLPESVSGEAGQRCGDGKAFRDCLPIWLTSVLIACLLNVTLWQYGEISMFYLSPYEPSTQIIVRQVALRLGILPANLLYLLAMLAGAAALHGAWTLLGTKRVCP